MQSKDVSSASATGARRNLPFATEAKMDPVGLVGVTAGRRSWAGRHIPSKIGRKGGSGSVCCSRENG